MDGADAFSPRGSCKLLALVGGHDPLMSLYDGADRLWDRLKVSPVLIPATTAAEAARKFRTEGADLVVTDGIGSCIRSLLPLLLLWSLTGCDAGGSSVATRGVRDGAGVRMVESAAPVWGEGESWRLAAEPALEIGVVEGDPRYEFAEINGSARLEDGRVVVADAGTRQIRYFDADGRHLVSVGRRGGGPAEFEDVSLVGVVPGDSVVVWDRRQARLSIITPDGELARSEQLVPVDGGLTPRVLGLYPDGSVLASFPTLLPQMPADGAVVQDSARLWRFDYRTGIRQRIVALPSFEALFWRGVSYQVPFFALAPRWTLHGEELYVAPSVEHEVHVYSPGGALRMRMRHLRDPVAVSPADAELVRRLAPQQAPPGAADPAGAVERLRIPEYRPAYGDLIVDAEANVWALHHRSPIDGDRDEPARWSVFRADGVLLGEVSVPARLSVLQVDRDTLLGIWRGDLGVSYVRLYPLLKPQF